MTISQGLLTSLQQDALIDFHIRLNGVAYPNARRDGFEEFRTSKAIALLIVGAVEIVNGQLVMSPLGKMLTEEGVQEEAAQ